MTHLTSEAIYPLRYLVLYFLRLGYSGFGGPVALVGYMHRDLVEKRGWISEAAYKEGLALSQLAPGPLAAQLSIYIGYIHYGVRGATLTGLAFVLPSFFMVLSLGMLYRFFDGLPWMQAAFYGVGAAVIGIIAMSAYKLTIKSVSRFNAAAIRRHWLLWLLYLMAMLVTVINQSENIWLLLASGLLYMLVKQPPRWPKKTCCIRTYYSVQVCCSLNGAPLAAWQFFLQRQVLLYLAAAWPLCRFCTAVLSLNSSGSPNRSFSTPLP